MAAVTMQALLCGAVAAPAVLSYIGGNSQTAAGSTITWTSEAIGTAAADRYVIVATVIHSGSTFGANPITSCTIGGITATLAGVQLVNGSTSDVVAIFYANVPTGTTANIVFNMATGSSRTLLDKWTVTGLLSATPTATANSVASPPTASITIPANGFAIGFCGNASAASGTWANMTERSDRANGTTWGSAADTGTSGTPTVTCTPNTGSDQAMVLAAWA